MASMIANAISAGVAIWRRQACTSDVFCAARTAASAWRLLSGGSGPSNSESSTGSTAGKASGDASRRIREHLHQIIDPFTVERIAACSHLHPLFRNPALVASKLRELQKALGTALANDLVRRAPLCLPRKSEVRAVAHSMMLNTSSCVFSLSHGNVDSVCNLCVTEWHGRLDGLYAQLNAFANQIHQKMMEPSMRYTMQSTATQDLVRRATKLREPVMNGCVKRREPSDSIVAAGIAAQLAAEAAAEAAKKAGAAPLPSGLTGAVKKPQTSIDTIDSADEDTEPEAEADRGPVDAEFIQVRSSCSTAVYLVAKYRNPIDRRCCIAYNS